MDWQGDHAVLIWHRSDDPVTTSPCDHFFPFVVVNAGTQLAEEVLGRVAAILEARRTRPEDTRAHVQSVGVKTNPALRALVHRPGLLLVGGSRSLRAPVLRLWASPVLHYSHPGELWMGSLEMGWATPDPPPGVVEAIEAALSDLRSAAR